MYNHKVIQPTVERIRQGDIFKNIRYLESYFEKDGEFEIKFKEFPYVIVMTQDCDLEQNKNEREKQKIIN